MVPSPSRHVCALDGAYGCPKPSQVPHLVVAPDSEPCLTWIVRENNAIRSMLWTAPQKRLIARPLLLRSDLAPLSGWDARDHGATQLPARIDKSGILAQAIDVARHPIQNAPADRSSPRKPRARAPDRVRMHFLTLMVPRGRPSLFR